MADVIADSSPHMEQLHVPAPDELEQQGQQQREEQEFKQQEEEGGGDDEQPAALGSEVCARMPSCDPSSRRP